MFGTDKISPDYTFTQSEDRFLKTSLSNALSNHFGSNSVSKKDQPKSLTDELKQDTSVKSKNDKKTEEKNEIEDNKNKIVDIFNEEENDESIGILYGGVSSITTSFDALAAAVGASDDRVTKSQLMALLQSLASDSNNSDKANEIAFVKNLIAKFDTLSGDTDYITSFNGVNDPQDYTTITKEQVTPPVDVRV